MAKSRMLAAIGLLVAAPPVWAAGVGVSEPPTAEPTANASGKYCLRVEAGTGSKVETVQCMTREQWAAQGVDLDKEWVEEGVVLQG